MTYYRQTIKKLFNIDLVSDIKYNKFEGYGILMNKENTPNFLILKTEQIENNITILKQFLNHNNKIIIEHTNVGEDKWYKEVYNEFKNRVLLNKKIINKFKPIWIEWFN